LACITARYDLSGFIGQSIKET